MLKQFAKTRTSIWTLVEGWEKVTQTEHRCEATWRQKKKVVIKFIKYQQLSVSHREFSYTLFTDTVQNHAWFTGTGLDELKFTSTRLGWFKYCAVDH